MTRTPRTSPKARRARQQLKDASKKDRPATERTLLILEALANAGRAVSLKELAGANDLPHATAFRLCQRLEQEGYLAREVGARRYAIGVKLMRLGLSIVQSSVPTSLRRSILAELVAALGETCNLTTLAGMEVLYLDRVETKWPLRMMLEPGSRVPLHCTASGKLFLATMPIENREQVLATLPLTAATLNTITHRSTLRRELSRIAKRGFSTDNEEFLAGLTAVAVPIEDRKRRVLAAVACHAPKARVDLQGLISQVDLLRSAAKRLAQTFDPDFA
jgi:IclR family transcriptional regulator, acetate operon repressor